MMWLEFTLPRITDAGRPYAQERYTCTEMCNERREIKLKCSKVHLRAGKVRYLMALTKGKQAIVSLRIAVTHTQ